MSKIKPLIDDEGEVRELTLEDFRRFRPIAEVFPRSLLDKLASRSVPPQQSKPRTRRGINAQLITEVLRAIAPQYALPAEIRDAVQRDKGVEIALTSIRHALAQLEANEMVEHVKGTAKWRYRAFDRPAQD